MGDENTGQHYEPFVTWPLIRSESAQVATNECEAACKATRETAREKSARAEHDALNTLLRLSPLTLLPMHDGKRRFEDIEDDDAAQFSSSLTNLHNTSPVACLPPDPHQPPLTYQPQSINTPMWNGKAETYNAWKAGLIPALAQLSYSDLLVTGDPNDPAVKVYVRANPEWDSSLFLHLQQACSAGHACTLCYCHRSTKSGNHLIHAICEQEEHGANIMHCANTACKQLRDL